MSKIGSCFVAAFKFPISCWWPTDPAIWPSAGWGVGGGGVVGPLTRKERARAEMASVHFYNLNMRLNKTKAINKEHKTLFFFLQTGVGGGACMWLHGGLNSSTGLI